MQFLHHKKLILYVFLNSLYKSSYLFYLGYCSVLNFEIKHTVFLFENIVLSIMNPFIFIKILNQKKKTILQINYASIKNILFER